MSTSGLFYLEKKAEANLLHGGIGALGGAGLGYLYNKLLGNPDDAVLHALIGAGAGGAAGALGGDSLLDLLSSKGKKGKKGKKNKKVISMDISDIDRDYLDAAAIAAGGTAAATGFYGANKYNKPITSNNIAARNEAATRANQQKFLARHGNKIGIAGSAIAAAGLADAAYRKFNKKEDTSIF